MKNRWQDIDVLIQHPNRILDIRSQFLQVGVAWKLVSSARVMLSGKRS
jgi:hypothetical protein